jgi:signal transduction histidine kinase
MNIDEILISTGIIIFLMLICIVTVFILFTQKTIQNISQKREFESQIQQAIISSQESEREELANNLHDDLGPILSILSRELKRDEHPGQPLTFSAEDRESIHAKVDGLIADIRKYSTEIYPTQIKILGLVKSLQQNVLDMSSQIETHFFDKMDYPPQFKLAQSLTIYRVVNEVLNNILKHGQSTELECELMTEENHFQIQIIHNGIPFTQEMFLQHAELKTGKGCSSILNRTRQLQGTIEFYRILEKHSCVRILIPMS